MVSALGYVGCCRVGCISLLFIMVVTTCWFSHRMKKVKLVNYARLCAICIYIARDALAIISCIFAAIVLASITDTANPTAVTTTVGSSTESRTPEMLVAKLSAFVNSFICMLYVMRVAYTRDFLFDDVISQAFGRSI